jgi:hypothetical protein
MQHSKPNPALKSLDVLVGEWNTEMSNMSFLSDPSAKVRGQDRFEWLEGGAFLISYSSVEQSDFPSSVRVIGRDDSVETYNMLYFDSRGVSRIYHMSLEDGTWKMWRNAPGFSQRFTGTFSDDGKTITARWEKSSDGATWEHDFDLTYQR